MTNTVPNLQRLVDPLVRERIAAAVCSQPWQERCESEVIDLPDLAAERVAAHLDRRGVYPPGGRRRTKMRRCAQCGGRWYPPHYVGREICLDCAAGEGVAETDEATHRSTTCSPTGMAMEQLERHRVRLVEPRLPAADEASLLRLIASYETAREVSSRAPQILKNTNVLGGSLIC